MQNSTNYECTSTKYQPPSCNPAPKQVSRKLQAGEQISRLSQAPENSINSNTKLLATCNDTSNVILQPEEIIANVNIQSPTIPVIKVKLGENNSPFLIDTVSSISLTCKSFLRPTSTI